MRKHRKIYQKVLVLLTAFFIGLGAFFSQYDNAFRSYYVDQMNAMSSMDIVIYKPLGGFPENDGVPSSEANDPVTDAELEQARQIEHVVDIRPRIDIAISPQNYDLTTYNIYEFPTVPYTMDIYDGQTLVSHKEFSVFDESPPVQNTYFEDLNYDSYIHEKYDDEGVYLSMHLAEYLSDGNIEMLRGKTIECDILIPAYDSVGKAWSVTPDNVIFYPTYTSAYPITIHLPIAGVLKQSSMGISNQMNNAIYIEEQVTQPYLEDFNEKSERTIYVYSTDPYE